tara:strand:+ start:1060 stop:1227 length:168 start_codon:yes stop_codon:yes gene_type:complete
MTISYKLFKTILNGDATHVVKTDNGVKTYIPFDKDNTDYQAYLEWAKTNTVEAAD